MEYNNVEDFEKPEVMYKWISSGALANPTFKITYYNEENCANVKPGNIKDFSHGNFYALINIESEYYSVEAPLVVNVVIEPTAEYNIVVTSNSFVYGNYTDAALAVTANYNALSLYGFAVFFKDDSTITANPDYLALMNQFIADNSDDGYELRTRDQVAYSSKGAYNTVGLFIPSDSSYLPKAFGYKYIVTAQPLDIAVIESIELTQVFTAPVAYNTTDSKWTMKDLTLSSANQYSAKIKIDGIATPVDGYVEFNLSVTLNPALLTTYFGNEGKLDWNSSVALVSFTSNDYNYSGYLSALGTKFLVKIEKPSLTTVITSISSINTVYTGTSYSLDITGLTYSFANNIKDQYNNTVSPNPLANFSDIVAKIYNGTTTEIAKFSSATLIYSRVADFNYTVSSTDVGSYQSYIKFEASTCFAETTYTINYNINKVEAGSISGLRYEYAEGQYINVLSEGFVADVWGNVASDGNATFYNKDLNVMLGATLDNSCFEILINGAWVKLTGNFAATVTYSILGSATPVPNLTADSFTNSETITITITFEAASVVNGVYDTGCDIEYYLPPA